MQESPHHGDRWFKDAVEQGERAQRVEETVRALMQHTKDAGVPLGGTGSFPLGAMTPDDEGGLRMAVTSQAGKVILAFGKPTQWVGMTPRQAREMADALSLWASRA